MLVGKPLGKMPWMTDGRTPTYFGRSLNFSTRRVRDSSSSPSTPRGFDDDEERSCSLSALHTAASSTLWNISGRPLSTAATCNSLRSLNPASMLDHDLPEATR